MRLGVDLLNTLHNNQLPCSGDRSTAFLQRQRMLSGVHGVTLLFMAALAMPTTLPLKANLECFFSDNLSSSVSKSYWGTVEVVQVTDHHDNQKCLLTSIAGVLNNFSTNEN